MELAIPKLRRGSFFPSLLERRRRIDRALYAVVMEAYVHGISTRKVDDLEVASQERHGNRNGRDRRHDEQRRDDPAHNRGADVWW